MSEKRLDVYREIRIQRYTNAGNGKLAHPKTQHSVPATPYVRSTGRYGYGYKEKRSIFDIIAYNKAYGMIGSVLMLPAIAILGVFLYDPTILKDPVKIAFASLLSFCIAGSMGYLLAEFKPYEWTGRIFLTLVIIGIGAGVIGGLIAGIAYVAYLVLKIVLGILAVVIIVAAILLMESGSGSKGS